ncbi:MAG: regulatory protein RecX [candidate division WOR-3 bacterium]
MKFRSYSINKLKRKLKDRGFEESEIDSVIAKLKKYGYINELEDAIDYVKVKCSRGWSRRKIQIALKRKYYNDDIIKEALNYYDEDIVINKLRRDISKKRLNREKIVKFLRNRGFEWNLIKRILEHDTT